VLGLPGFYDRDPGDVDDGVIRPRLNYRFQQILHDYLRARTVQRSDKRQCQDVLPQRTTGVEASSRLFLLAQDHIFARLLECGRCQQPEFVRRSVANHTSSATALASEPNSFFRAEKSGCLSEKTNEAVIIWASIFRSHHQATLADAFEVALRRSGHKVVRQDAAPVSAARVTVDRIPILKMGDFFARHIQVDMQ